MEPRSVFHEEWLRSLREHYKYVIRKDDRVTLTSLTAVMHGVGFRDAELAQLRLDATMHVDDVSDDFCADMSILAETKATTAHPPECAPPERVAEEESQSDGERGPAAPAPAAEDDEAVRVFPAAALDEFDAPKEAESVTFADSVAAEARQVTAEESELFEREDAGESDMDSPEQFSLF